MDMTPSARALELEAILERFMVEQVIPGERAYRRHREVHGPADHSVPPIVEELKASARELGLWNLFLPDESGLTQLEYARLAELTGWSMELAPEALNCAAPDTGNMELLHLLGTEEQKKQWLEPLLEGEIRSAFSMTEPEVASSDATNIRTRIVRDGDEFVITGRKWWSTGAADPRCRLLVVMGKTDPEAPVHRQQSMVLVPIDTPGVELVRSTPVLGHHHFQGHVEIRYHDVRVPVANLLGEEGGGFAAAQARLGPGRIHHVMRSLGVAERALALMVARTQQRVAFGKLLAAQSSVQEKIALSRMEIEQGRALCHLAAATIDADGNKAARHLVAMAKAAIPAMSCQVIDRAIQVHGGAGVSDDTPLAEMYGWQRAMRIFDGPDEVHLRSIARAELARGPRLPNAVPDAPAEEDA
ncbi:MAG: acyl-CoA dehydrogenase family protein [Nocardioidaceae bacterium]|nr:acyl-CoA dehydrogenase family protein [Nocardioidaceae bacterium]